MHRPAQIACFLLGFALALPGAFAAPAPPAAQGMPRATATFVLGNVQFLLVHEFAHLLIGELEVGSETARYERTDPGGEHHHHMVCDDCGKVLPFEDAGLERAVTKVTGGAGFEVRDHEIVLHGACDDCR